MSFSQKFRKKSPFKADTAPYSGKLYQGGGMNTRVLSKISGGIKKFLKSNFGSASTKGKSYRKI